MFAPAPSAMDPRNRTGILSWHYELSDDGKFALTEFVAANKQALSPMFNAPLGSGIDYLRDR